MNGSIIKEEKINNSAKWDLSELNQGIYLVRISDETNLIKTHVINKLE
ncbi:MAG: T9SS type A sorting domain-containing protein [Sphingobacteriaceae bacterium]|nr:T9SS type A sorting domain-containing protein [Sphingobacteriaceae bacterium]